MLRSDRATDNSRGRLRLGEAYESGKIRALRRPRRVRRRSGRPLSAAHPAGEIHHRRSARHDRGGRRPPHPVVGSRSRTPDLDRLWRLRRPESGGADPRRQGPAARSRPRRLRAGRDAAARTGAAEPGQDDRRGLGRERERRRVSSPRTSPPRSRACATATRPWPNFIRRPTPKSRRLPPRPRSSMQSASRGCRCRLRCRTRFPIRSF